MTRSKENASVYNLRDTIYKLEKRVEELEAAGRDALKVLLADPNSKVECVAFDTLAAVLANHDKEAKR